jgi:hypothetical protein
MRKVSFVLMVMTWVASLMAAQTSTQAAGSASGSGQTSAAAGQASAQTQADASAQAKTGQQLQAGSMIYAELSKSVDAKKAKQGDEVSAKTTQSVLTEGKVAIPKGAKLVGHVTQVQARTKEQQHSELGIAFDRAVLKDGTQVPFAATIQAVGVAQSNAVLPGEDDMGMSGPSGMQSPSGSGHGSASGGGMVGGVANTAGGVTGAATSTAGAAAGTTTGAVGATAGGHLGAASRGVVGLPGVSLSAGSSTSAQGSVLSSDKNNVKLDGGTELILRVNQ